MAKLKATPKNFAEALQAFDNFKRGSRIGSVRLGNNTYLESYVDGCKVDRICVRLHDTNIVTFCEDGRVLLYTGGYRTATTKQRLNQFVNGRVRQTAYQWFYISPDGTKGTIFEEGINVA